MVNLFERINSPADLRTLTEDELTQLAAEIRQLIIEVVSVNGGHLASSLGAVDLTIALHRVFNSPTDRIVFDVGHQSYTHKLLTGRKQRFSSIRQYGGLSGFPALDESRHDAFGTGHAGTSISAALGMALARDLSHEDYHVVAVIGDGSMGAGMAFEGLNHAGHLGKRLIVILNDNGMSISPSIGALSRLLNKVRLDKRVKKAESKAKSAFSHLPLGKLLWSVSKQMKRGVERTILPGALWEELCFTYLGPCDGHNIPEIEKVLTQAKNLDSRPALVHVLTKKGKGLNEAERNATKFHGVSPAGVTGNQPPSYSQVFGQTVCHLMQENDRIVAISAAMLDGTGLSAAAAQFPGRVFDVGICEQHAVTMAAGLATRGYIPIVAIYSTFLQRAYDQVIHDVCLQNLPVVFAIDRAGIVGDDGKTHQGSFDLSFLRCIPNMMIASPSDEDELQHLLFTAIHGLQPMAIRFPRGNGQGVPLSGQMRNLALGKGELLKTGRDLTIVAAGPLVYNAVSAAEILAGSGVECGVINARFVKPLDSELILGQARFAHNLVTLEENSLYGGLGAAVMEALSAGNLHNVKVKCLGLPDRFIEHGPQELLRSLLNINTRGIVTSIQTDFPELFSKETLAEWERAPE
jgi:1-deoxy-D-xylulose-5-phosphate synthase